MRLTRRRTFSRSAIARNFSRLAAKKRPCKSRIWFTRSTDGGLHWEVSKKVNDPKGDLSDQFNQRLAIDPETGTLGLIYYNSGTGEYRRMTNLVCQGLDEPCGVLEYSYNRDGRHD